MISKKRMNMVLNDTLEELERNRAKVDRLEAEIDDIHKMFRSTVDGCNILMGGEKSSLNRKIEILREEKAGKISGTAYDIGARNGIEFCLAVLTGNEPKYDDVVPVKPKSKVRHGANGQIQKFCGNCMQMLHGKSWKYCPTCGREIDWRT